MSQETHAGQWLGFRQPVLRVAREKRGETINATYEANPGEVWEENEFWIALTLEDRSRRLARHPQVLRVAVPARREDHDGRVLRLDVRELRARAAGGRGEGEPDAARSTCASTACSRSRTSTLRAAVSTALDARRSTKIGATACRSTASTACARLQHAVAQARVLLADAGRLGLAGARGAALRARATCTGATSKRDEGEFDLLPNFRLPTLIHTRSPVKWLYEISHNNPLWIATGDARKLGIATGDLVKVRTGIGYFVTRAWVTEGIRPGVLGMSHHLGRWRLNEDTGGARSASALVTIARERTARYEMRRCTARSRSTSNDPDSARDLVERGRRAPEPDVPGAARSGQRHALLASAGDAREGRPGRSLRRHRRRHRRSRTRSTRSGWR